jgi:hypothetical protein
MDGYGGAVTGGEGNETFAFGTACSGSATVTESANTASGTLDFTAFSSAHAITLDLSSTSSQTV